METHRVQFVPSSGDGLSLLCLSHDNLGSLATFIANVQLLDRAWAKRVGLPVEVIILDSSVNAPSLRLSIGEYTTLELRSYPKVDMIEKISRGIEDAIFEIIMLWTVDDLFISDVVIDCYEAIVRQGYTSAGGARAQLGESFVRRTKERIHLVHGIEKLEQAFIPYDAYIYFLSIKTLLQSVIQRLLTWTSGFNVFEYANLFEVSFAAMMLSRGSSIFYYDRLMHLSRFTAHSLGSRAFNPARDRHKRCWSAQGKDCFSAYKSFMLKELRSSCYDRSIRERPHYALGIIMNAFTSSTPGCKIAVQLPSDVNEILA